MGVRMKKFFVSTSLLLTFNLFAEEVAKHVIRPKITYLGFLMSPKFISMFVIAIIALYLLKTGRMQQKVRIPLLILTTFLYGIAGNIPIDFFKSFAMHPSPICASTKPFLFGLGIPFMGMLTVIAVLTIIGPKLFCSYICPVGAIQELMTAISTKKKVVQWKPSFSMLNGIRISIFIVFIIFSVTKIYHIVYKGKVYGLSIYDKINAFHGFEFQLSETFLGTFLHYLPLLLTLILALKVYRPFCYAVCPIGLFSNILEQIGLTKLSFVKSNCTDCNLCISETACPAIPEILKDAEVRPDCFACNHCIDACNQGALKYGIKKTV